MKSFNEIIAVEVAVDSIAQMLLSQINPEFKHREMLVETIIGMNIENNTIDNLSHIYNSLNGFTSDINFKPGDMIATKGRGEHLFIDSYGIKGIVKQVNKYANRNKLVVEFTHKWDISIDSYIELDEPIIRDISHYTWEVISYEDYIKPVELSVIQN